MRPRCIPEPSFDGGTASCESVPSSGPSQSGANGDFSLFRCPRMVRGEARATAIWEVASGLHAKSQEETEITWLTAERAAKTLTSAA